MKSVSQEKQTSCRERGWRLRWRWSGNKQLELNRKSRTIVEQPWFLHRWRAPSRKSPKVLFCFVFFSINDADDSPTSSQLAFIAAPHPKTNTLRASDHFLQHQPLSLISREANELIYYVFFRREASRSIQFLSLSPQLMYSPLLRPSFLIQTSKRLFKSFFLCVGGVGLSAGGLATLDESLWPHNLSILKFKHSNTLSKHWRVMSF